MIACCDNCAHKGKCKKFKKCLGRMANSGSLENTIWVSGVQYKKLHPYNEYNLFCPCEFIKEKDFKVK